MSDAKIFEAKLNEITTQIARTTPILPVVVIESADDAVPLAETLFEAGLVAIEITLRTQAALAAIEQVATKVPQMLLSAGTVLNGSDLRAARNAGAAFAISPGATPALLTAACEQQMPIIPGVATASDVIQAIEFGLGFCKFFPAGIAGGIEGLKALHGPFPHMKFCPTGGVSLANAKDYLRLPNVACVGGSWLTPAAAMREKDWGNIAKLAREATAQLGPNRA